MASTVEVPTVQVTINGAEVTAPKGELLIETIRRAGQDVPIFCYHSRLKPVGMCRMCLVQVGMTQADGTVRNMPKPQTACSLPVAQGMVVVTDTESIHQDRKGILEFLLINHPLDCPICDRGGECPLQNNTLFYGPSTSRYVEMKRHLPKAFPLSQHITMDLERCIQCGRCVRFTEEISGDAQLALLYRGAWTQPKTFHETEFDSKFSGNVIEICPVGALTSSTYRFRSRPWDLETKPAICTECSNGCNVWFDHRGQKMVRINGRTNEAVNEEWTCDRGKFGHEWYNSPDRLTQPMVREGSELKDSNWPEVYARMLTAFSGAGSACAVLVGTELSNEALYLTQKLARESFGTHHIDHRFYAHAPVAGQSVERVFGRSSVQSTLESLGEEKAVLVFESSLADEEPMAYLRVRKGWFQHGCRVVVASSFATDADSFAHAILRFEPGKGLALAEGLAGLIRGKGKAADVASSCGVDAASLELAVSALTGCAAPVLATRSLYDLEDGSAVVSALVDLAGATGGKFNLWALRGNEQGCLELGILPGTLPGWAPDPEAGMGTAEILRACADGKIKALWLAGVDPITLFGDAELARRALENVEFLAVQGAVLTEATAYASVVLPCCAPAEAEGSYTNAERRVQRFPRVLGARGAAKSGWRIASELWLRAEGGMPDFGPSEVMKEIASRVPAFEGVRYTEIPAEGQLLG